MSNVDQQRANESIAGKQVQGGTPADLEFIRFNFANNQWEFVPATGGEVNTGANVGAGTGLVFRDKIGVALNFKSLLQGANMTITNNADDITIATLAEINLAANVGAGVGLIFRDKTGVTLNLKSLLAGANITLTNNADDITIAAPAPGVDSETVSDFLASTFTTTSSILVDTGLSLTLPNISGGNFWGQFSATVQSTVISADMGFSLDDAGTKINEALLEQNDTASSLMFMALMGVGAADGGTLKVQAKTSAGTLTLFVTSGAQVRLEVIGMH